MAEAQSGRLAIQETQLDDGIKVEAISIQEILEE